MSDITSLLIAQMLKGQDSYKTDPLYTLGSQMLASPPIGKEYRMSTGERFAAGLLTGLIGGGLRQYAKASSKGDDADTLGLAQALANKDTSGLNGKYKATADAILELEKQTKQQELSDFAAKKKLEAITDINTGKASTREIMNPNGVTTQNELTYDPSTDSFYYKQYGRSQSPGEKKLAEALAEKQAGNIAYGGVFDPEKAAAIEDSMRKELKQGTPVEQFQKGEVAFQNMVKAFPDTSGASDLDFLYGAVQTREPGMAVRKDDQDLARAAFGIGGVFSDAAGYLTSGRKFTPEMRKAMLDAAGRARDARINLLKQDFDTASGIAERRKIDPKNIIPFNLPKYSSDLIGQAVSSDSALPPNLSFEEFKAMKRSQGK